MESDSKREMKITLAVLLAIVLIVGGAIVFSRQQAENKTASPQTNQSNTSDNAKQAAPATDNSKAESTARTYKDGAYQATGQYDSPGGNEAITVNVTLKDGIVTDTSAQGHATDGEALEYQSEFIGSYKKMVVGKKIDDIQLSRVSGSSLTSQGFNRALDQIESEAVQKS